MWGLGVVAIPFGLALTRARMRFWRVFGLARRRFDTRLLAGAAVDDRPESFVLPDQARQFGQRIAHALRVGSTDGSSRRRGRPGARLGGVARAAISARPGRRVLTLRQLGAVRRLGCPQAAAGLYVNYPLSYPQEY